MKQQIEQLLAAAMARVPDLASNPDLRGLKPELERARDPRHGDYASNLAMQLARTLGRKPREIATDIVAQLPESDLLSGVEIAGPGFINFRLSAAAFQRELARIMELGHSYGCNDDGAGRKIIIEFVSANPTGPLHVGHGRHAAYGDSVAKLLEASGHEVHREYYVNDAGRQMDILAASVWIRMLEAAGRPVSFPTKGYRGEYVRQIAEPEIERFANALSLEAMAVFDGLPPDAPEGDPDAYLDALIQRAREVLGEATFGAVHRLALEHILEDIRDDLAEFGVTFDRWFSEQSLIEDGAVERALARVKEGGHTYEKDGAVWFRATGFGDEKDRPVVRANGRSTYFASDIAYHLQKRERGYDHLVDILGADHHGYVARVRAGLQAMGEPADCLEVNLVQFVTLFRGDQKVQMSTKAGEFVTLRDLRREVGNDAARVFYVLRANEQHLDFDLELAKSQSNENPVYYIQYAHARICSVLKEMQARGEDWTEERGARAAERLSEPQEQQLMRALARYPEIVELAARQRAPQHIVHYLRDLANDLHSYYNAHRFLVDDQQLRDARLLLVLATRQVLRNGLDLIGVSAPASM